MGFHVSEGGLAATVFQDTPGAPKPLYTPDQIAEYLVSGYWNQRSFDVSTGGAITVRINGLTAEGQQLARWALDAWSNVTGITFVEMETGPVDILLDDLDPSGAYSTSIAPGGVITFSYVNVPVNWLDSYGTTIDSYSFPTYIHEIGHALGLGHAGDYNASASFWLDAHYQNDSWQMTVMSYFSQTENPYVDADYAEVVTPMLADIIAMQMLYGDSTTANAGNTIYGANSNAGGYMEDLFGIMFDGDVADPAFYGGGPVAYTINDDGGVDTLDFSTVAGDQLLDLREDGISDIAGLKGNVVIGRGSVIENGMTGGGDDRLIGNDVNNVLDGGAGRDLVIGFGGNDEMTGGSGNDLMGGGSGADVLQGGAGIDLLFGSDGSDEINGGGSNDFLFGGADADSFVFTAFNASETDRIRDFQDGIDMIEMQGVAGGFGALSISDGGAGAVVSYLGHDIVLAGMAAADLTADDFIFTGVA